LSWVNGLLVTSNSGVPPWLVLRLLIDTSTWLDLAGRRTGQQWIVPLRVLKHQGALELLVPPVVIEEFDRNRVRSETAVTTSVLDRLRQLRRELREYAGEKHEQIASARSRPTAVQYSTSSWSAPAAMHTSASARKLAASMLGLTSAHPRETPACSARRSGRANARNSATAWSWSSIRPRAQCRRQTAEIFADRIWSAVLTPADPYRLGLTLTLAYHQAES
jgi:hypothetical protein